MAAPMNVMAAVRSYVDKIVGDPNCPGMKVLLLDEWTTKTVAMVYSQTEILDRDIYLVERLDQAQNHEVMKHLKACVFVRPTPANFAVLTQEVRRAKFSEYHVFFSNVVPGDALKALAEADENEVVRQVQEYYADFVPVNAELFSLNQPSRCGCPRSCGTRSTRTCSRGTSTACSPRC
jgi:vacuolar protein sorting-associated protein 45